MQNRTTSDYETLVSAYEFAAIELRSAQTALRNYSVELWAFLEAKAALENHADFAGVLPVTYFS